jgi:hypothetical protein
MYEMYAIGENDALCYKQEFVINGFNCNSMTYHKIYASKIDYI